MPRPRFDKLDPERRAKVLSIAAEEFAEHGYEAASYNRIIERAGVSKGAFYYYFDDKEDLYATVLRDAMQRLVLDASEMAIATDRETFWIQFEAWYVRSLRMFQEEPHAVGLARSLVKAMARGAATGVLAELRAFARGYMDTFIAHGQSLDAIRKDLPQDLLTSVLMALEEGIDLWLGDRIGDMTEAEMTATASMLTQFYRRVAEAPSEATGGHRPPRDEAPREARRKAPTRKKQR